MVGNVSWDERMHARKTASFGKAYNYSHIQYDDQEFLPEISNLVNCVHQAVEFKPNNCLLNYYLNGKSKMGFHSDQTDNLYDQTGVAIISIGENRTLRFRNIEDPTILKRL